MDCGAACLQMILAYYGKDIPLSIIRSWTFSSKLGTSFYHLSQVAEQEGLDSIVVKVSQQEFEEECPCPAIAFVDTRHFVIITEIKKRSVTIADPAAGMLRLKKEDFLKTFLDPEGFGTVMAFQPRADFNTKKTTGYQEVHQPQPGFLSILFHRVIKKYKKALLVLFGCLLGGSILQFLFPFMTQSIVDTGIRYKDIHFIWLLLGIRIVLFLGQIFNDFGKSLLLTHLSHRVNISLVSDFFNKMLRLPVSFFDSKFIGDILQRIHDNDRVESFLTHSIISTLFSVINFTVFSIILAIYSMQLLSLIHI